MMKTTLANKSLLVQLCEALTPELERVEKAQKKPVHPKSHEQPKTKLPEVRSAS